MSIPADGKVRCLQMLMHGDSPEYVTTKISDMRDTFTRDSEQEVQAELDRITNVQNNAKGFANYQQWLRGTQLEQKMSLEEYSVSNRGLRSKLYGTPDQVQEQVGRFEEDGVNLLLLQFSPQFEEMERFSETVIRKRVLQANDAC